MITKDEYETMLDALIMAVARNKNVGCAKRKLLRHFDRRDLFIRRVKILIEDSERET